MAVTQKPITQRQYIALRRDVQKLLEAAAAGAAEAKLESYWNVGARIQRERLAQAAGYHNSILRDLAADLHVAERSLQRALRLRKAYAKPPRGKGLTWSHYRTLLLIGSPEQRRFYEREAIRQAMSARQLAAAVSANLFEGGRVPETLARPTLPAYVYRAEVLLIVDGDTFDLSVDLGFDVHSKHRTRLACIDAPEMDSPAGRDAKRFVAAQLVPARTVVIQSLKADVHGRYLVHVFFSPLECSIDECFASGTHLNDLLVRKGFAVVVG